MTDENGYFDQTSVDSDFLHWSSAAPAYRFGGPKASSRFPGCPFRKPTYPEVTKTIPFTTTAPADPRDPPLPGTPLTVVTFWVVSYCQSCRPSKVEKARSVPSSPGAKTTPGTTLTAALKPRCDSIEGTSVKINAGQFPGAGSAGQPLNLL